MSGVVNDQSYDVSDCRKPSQHLTLNLTFGSSNVLLTSTLFIPTAPSRRDLIHIIAIKGRRKRIRVRVTMLSLNAFYCTSYKGLSGSKCGRPAVCVHFDDLIVASADAMVALLFVQVAYPYAFPRS